MIFFLKIYEVNSGNTFWSTWIVDSPLWILRSSNAIVFVDFFLCKTKANKTASSLKIRFVCQKIVIGSHEGAQEQKLKKNDHGFSKFSIPFWIPDIYFSSKLGYTVQWVGMFRKIGAFSSPVSGILLRFSGVSRVIFFRIFSGIWCSSKESLLPDLQEFFS